ncbi:DUF3418 domain-containing protein [Schaalia hyovaginalis]|uniref:DUF3418 domain-containing protein n=1 Tax=Schaalia hyovaginalis TaxID=29316 RepID=UPI001617A39E
MEQHPRPRRTRRPRHERARAFRPFTPEQLAERAAAIPVITYPDLPVSARREEIAEAIRTHQVTIVSGETGSGKTTQLPKICMQLGRGVTGMIGHTQPRRIAARSVAERIAEELGQTLGREAGQVVGYQVRFTDEVGPTTLVKLMTDGILLAEIQADPLLRRYDTLIIDEAHERSLNIDFILGYLARLLPARPDLKVIITSATIDSARFAEHFGRWEGTPGRGALLEPAPVIEVSGRTYPVEIRYRPLAPDVISAYSTSTPRGASDSDPSVGAQAPGVPGSAPESPRLADAPGPAPVDQSGSEQLVLEDPDDELPSLGYGLGEEIDVETAICDAVDELCAEGEGDILVFLPGERDIRDTEQALLDHLGPRGVRAGETKGARPTDIEIVPLFARLSAAEQHRVFEEHRLRRVVLATNVAETSLTVPGIRYVIDPGLARISRYSNRTKVQRLPIEPVSQASANQRAGRCGRVADGIAIRLYSQRDYEGRPRYTEPEILRTSLASVILQMAALGLGSVEDFPFLDAPERRAVRDGIAALVEIGALAADEGGRGMDHRLTRIGRELARLPIDPRLGRILLEGDANGCASEVLVIVAALSIQDVRERPLDHQQAADAAHARFSDPRSDFITYLNLWRYLEVQSRDLSGSQFRRMCRAEFLHYLRYREWRDVVVQLRQMARPLDLDVHPIDLPAPGDVIEAAQSGGVKDAAARAAVSFTASSRTVDADEIHRSMLVGLLSNLGSWDEAKREYRGARGTRFTIWPGSGLSRSHPAWVMTAELVETSRLFARTVARIDPAWIEPLAGPLLTRVYSEPFWSSAKGAAMVKEKVLLYGLTISADRPVLLGRLGERVIDEDATRAPRLVTAGSLAGIAQGLLGVGEEARSARQIGSVGRDFLAMALAAGLDPGDEAGAASSSPASSAPARPDIPDPADAPARSDAPDGARTPVSPNAPEAADTSSGARADAPASTAETPSQALLPSRLTARELARDMFIRHALVEGEWRERHRFQARNAELLEQAREVERRSRTHGLVADEEARFRFFDDILPEGIVSAAHFNRWWKREREQRPELLIYTERLLLPRGIGEDTAGFPDTWRSGDLELALSYAFTPGSERDGVTLTIPVEALPRVSDEGADWLVPGMREELITETIRALPKAKRRLLAPAPEVAHRANEWMDRAIAGALGPSESTTAAPLSHDEAPDPTSLSAAMDRLARWGASTGVATRKAPGSAPTPPSVPSGPSPAPPSSTAGAPDASIDWSVKRPSFSRAFADAMRILRGVELSETDLAHARAQLPAHLLMTFSVVDSAGKELGAGTDLVHLQHRLAKSADEAVRKAVRGAVAEAMIDAAAAGGRGRGRACDPAGKKGGGRPQKARRDQERRAPEGLHLDALSAFPAAPLPRSVDSPGESMTLRGFPALVAQGSAGEPAAGVRVMANAQEADRHHREGLARLLLLRVRLPRTRVTTRWTGRQALMLAASPYPDTPALVDDAQLASALALVDELCAERGPGSIRDAGAFEALVARARDLHEDRVHALLGHVVRALEAQSEVADRLASHAEKSMREVVGDVRRTVDALLAPGFVSGTPAYALPHLARYLRAGAVRIDRASASPGALDRDLADMDRIHELLERITAARAEFDRRPYDARADAELTRARWLVEELRVSCFAQTLGTPNKVSFKRVASLIEQVS